MWIQIAVGGFFCLFAIFELVCAARNKQYFTRSVQGEIIHTDENNSSPTVLYTVGGREYKVKMPVELHNRKRYYIHETCVVRYHPENPEQSVPDNGVNPFLLYSAVILLCILFMVLSYLKILNLGLIS